MSNLVRFLCTYNSNSGKLLRNWKLCSKTIEVQLHKSKSSIRWYHFTKRKTVSIKKKPLNAVLKVSLGTGAGIGVRILLCDSLVVPSKKHLGFHNEEITFCEPEFKWKKFFQLLSNYWLEFLTAIITAVLCALINVQMPHYFGDIIKLITQGLDYNFFMRNIKRPVMKLFGLMLLQSGLTILYISLLSYVGEGLAKTLKVNLFSTIMKQDIAFFDDTSSAEILQRFSVDIAEFKSSFKTTCSKGIQSLAQIIGCSITLYFISPTMTGILVVVFPIVSLAGTILGSMLRHYSVRAKMQNATVTLLANEAITNMRTVRAFAMEEVEKKIIEEECDLAKKHSMRFAYGLGFFQAGTYLCLNSLIISTLCIGGYMISLNHITAGELTAFILGSQIIERSFTQISVIFGTFLKGIQAGARVFEMIDLPEGTTLKPGKIIPYHEFIPSIEFNKVFFSYPSRPNKAVLNGINLEIPAGKRVAIVGSSGSGKSTIAKLIERFYDNHDGTILIGGEDIKTLDPNWLRGRVMGLISQEPVLFATSVMENIRFGLPSATDEEVIEAAKLANAHDFINQFPEGYNTLVGERGTSISGGQKQRIAIARALLKNPAILILDEATSALDSESEKAVRDSLEKFTKSRTTIVIAHRLSTVKHADLILVLQDGVIVEQGTHDELMHMGGLYATFVTQENFS